MIEKIPIIPKVPPEIIDAAKDDRLVLFVGTGPSISMGAATWNEFANNVLKQVTDYSFIDQLSSLDPRKRLSIARVLAEDKNIDYKKAIMPSGKEKRNSKIYDHLLGIGSHFVTTNYDDYLDQRTQEPFNIQDDIKENEITDKNIIHDPSNIDANSLKIPKTVVHLHGSFSSETTEELVITTEDYLEQYHESNNDRQRDINSFLENLFDGTYTILFVGYGLEELELLEYILAKPERLSKSTHCTRFWLQGCFSHEKETYEQLKRYYKKNFNIEMRLYSLDNKRYDALEDVIEKWKLEIGKNSISKTDGAKFIDNVLDNE